MKTKEELLQMEKEELASYAESLQCKASLNEYVLDENRKLREYLSAVEIIIRSYKS